MKTNVMLISQTFKLKCEQALAATDSPEIKALQDKVEKYPNDLEIKVELSNAFNGAGRKEEALELLFNVLKKDQTTQMQNQPT